MAVSASGRSMCTWNAAVWRAQETCELRAQTVIAQRRRDNRGAESALGCTPTAIGRMPAARGSELRMAASFRISSSASRHIGLCNSTPSTKISPTIASPVGTNSRSAATAGPAASPSGRPSSSTRSTSSSAPSVKVPPGSQEEPRAGPPAPRSESTRELHLSPRASLMVMKGPQSPRCLSDGGVPPRRSLVSGPRTSTI
jgi:hypothetical protein